MFALPPESTVRLPVGLKSVNSVIAVASKIRRQPKVSIEVVSDGGTSTMQVAHTIAE